MQAYRPVLLFVLFLSWAVPTESRAVTVELLVGYRQSVQMTPGKILKFDAGTGTFLGEFAEVAWPLHMTAGPNGNLYVADFTEHAIEEYSLTTGSQVNGFVIPPTGSVPPLNFFADPFGIDFGPDGFLYAASYHHDRIYRYTPDGTPAPEGPFPLSVPIEEPVDMEFGPDDLIYVTSPNGIYRYDPTSGQPVDAGPFAENGAFTFNASGDLFVVTQDNGVRRYAAGSGVDLGLFVPAGTAGVSGATNPTDLLFGPNGNMFVVSHDLAGVLEFDGTTGSYLRAILPPAGYSAPFDLYFNIIVPEPASWVLYMAALLGMVSTRHIRTT